MTDETTALSNSELWKAIAWILTAMGLGILGRALMAQQPINWRVFFGELCLATVCSGTLLAFGMLQGMEFWQIVFIGGLAGIGGVKSLEWSVQIYKAMRSIK